MGGTRNFYLISYDLPDDRRRLKIMHLLEGYGERVQYSVFEVWATETELEKLRKQLARWVKGPAEGAVKSEPGGSVRIYGLCGECRGRREVLGEGEPTSEPAVHVL